MAGNWQMVRNKRWASLPSMASMSGFCLSHSSADSGLPTLGCSVGSDTRSREGRSSTARLDWPSEVQNSVGVLSLRVLPANSLAQASTATTIWAEGCTSWSGSS